MSRQFAVIGLGFGDEGKGRVVDCLCSRLPNSVVVRFSGGHQAGHNVVIKDPAEGLDVQHVFSNFGSGTFRGCPTIWSRFCTFEPIGFLREYNILVSKGVKPVIYIDSQCPVVTPYDINDNRRIDSYKNHGSCGVGFGATVDREARFYSLTFLDLFYPSVLQIKLEQIRKYYEGGTFNFDTVGLAEFFDSCEIISKLPGASFIENRPACDNVIFEGSQGLMLDQHFGLFPHVTRSNTGLKNLEHTELLGDTHVILVTRAYQTRHGNGPMTNEDILNNIKIDTKETNLDSTFQGKFRRSLLDVSLLEYAIKKEVLFRSVKTKHLAITCLDHIECEYRFTYNGEVVICADRNDFVDRVSSILKLPVAFLSDSPVAHTMEDFTGPWQVAIK